MTIGPLLSTKWSLPPVRKELVIRPHLAARLEASLEYRLLVLSAPAGFGKTTLLSSWARSCPAWEGRRVAWLTLDEGDNDPALFLAYLLSALLAGSAPVELPVEGDLPLTLPFNVVLKEMINQIAAWGKSLLLALDDYHVITASAVHDAVVFLVEHAPPNFHLALASRADPPLPLPRWRARGHLAEIHLADLRFSEAETEAFLNQVMGLGLGKQDVAALEARTEGWIAGLQMVAVSLQGHPQAGRFIQGFTGSHRFILDYLMEEVLQRRTPEDQAFLLRTSLVEQVCGELCQALMPALAPGEGQKNLESLERANLFLMPLDEERHWYRYHRLFADLLRRQLLQTFPGEIEELHQRACTWYAAQGMFEEAIDHALQMQDYTRAGDLIEAKAEDKLMHSQMVTLMDSLEALPKAQLSARPRLHLFYAWTLLLGGRSMQELNAHLADLEAEKQLPAAYLAPLLAYMAIFRGQILHAVSLAQQAVRDLPEDENFLRGVAKWVIQIGSLTSVSREQAALALEQVIQSSQRAGNTLLVTTMLASLADIYVSQGNLELAADTCQRALELSVDGQGNPLPVSGISQYRLGDIRREQNRLAEAEALLREGIQRMEQWNELGVINGHALLAFIQQERGQTQAANASIEKARQMAVRLDATRLDDRIVSFYQLQVRLLQGDLEFVRVWLDQDQYSPGGEMGEMEALLRERESLYRARALTALGRGRETLELLAPLLPEFERAGRRRRVIEGHILVAMAYASLGEGIQASEELERALELNRAGGFVRLFVNEGETMRRLLVEAAGAGRAASEASRLLEAFPPRPAASGASSPTEAGDYPEKLSQREIDVLRMVAAGLSNQEIADRLYISLRTVKFHCGNIFAKMGVKTRAQATAQARNWLD